MRCAGGGRSGGQTSGRVGRGDQSGGVISLAGRSAGLGVLLGQVVVDIVLANPVGAADPRGGQLPSLDQPVHRHVGHPKLIGYLSHGYEPGPGLVWLHARGTTLLRTDERTPM